MIQDPLADLVGRGIEILAAEDAALHDMLQREYRRQSEVLTMVAASSIVDPSVLVAESSLMAEHVFSDYKRQSADRRRAAQRRKA